MSTPRVATSSDWPEEGPIVVLGRGHSGTRFLAEALQKQGVFIGGKLNRMFDTQTWVEPIQDIVLGAYPRYDLCAPGDAWHRTVEDTTRQFLAEGYTGGPWGWKIGIAAFVVPLLADVFPHLRVIHLIRDGRDVMLSRLRRVPGMVTSAANRKMILGDPEAQWWWGRRLTARTITRYRNEFEMLAWVQFVTTARRFGQPLGPHKYLEIRYEDLCRNPVPTARRVLEFAGLPMKPDVHHFLEANARTSQIGKWKGLPPREIAGAVSIGRLLLADLGYTDSGSSAATQAGLPGSSVDQRGQGRGGDSMADAVAGVYRRARRLLAGH
jgi:hypothetical protein